MDDVARAHDPTPSWSASVPPSDPGPVPSPVRTAVLLVWALLVVDGIVMASIVLSLPGDVRDDVVATRPDLDPAAVDVSAALTVGAVIGLLMVCALYAVVAVQLRAGRTWPRTVLVVLACLGVLGQLVPAAEPVALTSLASSLLGLGLLVAAVVLLFRPVSRAWLLAWRAVRADARRRRLAW